MKHKPFFCILAASVCAFLLLTACGGETEARDPVGSPSTENEARQSSDNGGILLSEEVSLWAGSLTPGFSNGENKSAQFLKPYGLCRTAEGGLLIVDSYANELRMSDGCSVSGLAGRNDTLDQSGYPLGGYLNGSAEEAYLSRPRFADVSAEGVVVFTDTGNNRIRVLMNGTVRLLAGDGTQGFQNGSYQNARFHTPSGIAIGKDGTIYVADTLNHCIRAISPEGQVSTLAGVPQQSGYKDSSYGTALFCEPNDIELGPDGALYVVDKGNQRIRRIADGQVTTIAGNGSNTDPTTGYFVGGYLDGPGTQALFLYPTGLSIAPDGSIYVADTGNNCIRKLAPDHTVTTVAGTKMPGNVNGSKEKARFNQPLDVCYTAEGGLYVSDSYNHVIRLIRDA